MRCRITHSMRIAILVLYCIYAVSPIYLSALTGRRDVIAEAGQATQKVTVGIVWVRVLLSSFLCTDQEPAPASVREVKADDQDKDFILIRKKRAVLPDVLRIRPLLEKTAVLFLPTTAPVPTSYVKDVPRRICFRQENVSIFSHAGLSPPRRSS